MAFVYFRDVPVGGLMYVFTFDPTSKDVQKCEPQVVKAAPVMVPNATKATAAPISVAAAPAPSTSTSSPPPSDDPLDYLETPDEQKSRRRSIVIMYITMFIMSVGFSLVITGVWPYLETLDNTVDKSFLGWVVAAYPIGQMIASPLMGLAWNRFGSLRPLCVLTILVFIIGNGMYAVLNLFHSSHKYWMFLARIVVGISAANIALCRAYLAGATLVKERTQVMSIVAAAQALGFVIGPSLQVLLTPLGENGVQGLGSAMEGLSPSLGTFTLNMYTAAGWLGALLGVINLLLFLPGVFNEHQIALREARYLAEKTDSSADDFLNRKPDYTTAAVLLFFFFVVLFIFVLIETLLTPLTMDQFAWTEEEAIRNVGILMTAGAAVSVVCFAITGPICRRFDERKVMVLIGYIPLLLACLVLIPYSGPSIPLQPNKADLAADTTVVTTTTTEPPPSEIHDMSHVADGILTFLKIVENPVNSPTTTAATVSTTASTATSTVEAPVVGCPPEQTWCATSPALTLAAFVAGYAIISVGYPFSVSLTQTLFSKVLGPHPQGMWMGLLTAGGSLSRSVGPIYVTQMYMRYGTAVTFGSIAAIVSFMILLAFLIFNRLVPWEVRVLEPAPWGNRIPEPVPAR